VKHGCTRGFRQKNAGLKNPGEILSASGEGRQEGRGLKGHKDVSSGGVESFKIDVSRCAQ